jgi:hypothetical protein
VVTAAVIAAFEHRALRGSAGELAPPERPVIGLGLAAVVVATVLAVALPSPALPVLIAGAAVAGFRLQPSVARASRLGAIAVPLSMAAALAVLALTGSS